jgi:hypothetical protein
MEEFFSKFTNEQIEEMIKELSPYQKDKFDHMLAISESRRMALFYAKSFSITCLPDHEHINDNR